ncbi:MAG TPA: serine/threonine-protein kinase [Gemmatimonadales bacterium]|nr:serine/threonine-protein kinase [Gemmatimonadales bacterium]
MKDDLPARLTAILGDRYRLEMRVDGKPALIGQGGMATVFLAEDPRHDRWVAIKVLKPDVATAIGAERFLREIHIAAQLHHPHILGLIDSGQADGLLYYVMPYVAGDTLRERIEKEGALPIPEAVRLLREIADALARAHKAGVIHRDIKPENVLIEERHALVSDFGVAKALSEATDSVLAGRSTAGFTIGTPAYMAPEQAAGDPAIDHRADIYALGIVAYEMLTGDVPFDAPTPQGMLAAQVSVEPALLRTRRLDVPPMLEALVMKCLIKDPDKRFQRADEILDAIEAMGTPSLPGFGGALPAPQGSWWSRLPHATRLTLILGAIILGAILLLGVLR